MRKKLRVYNVLIEGEGGKDDLDLLIPLVEELNDWHEILAAGTGWRRVPWAVPGPTARMHIEAGGLEEAVRIAVHAFGRATKAVGFGTVRAGWVQATTEDRFDRELDEPADPLLGLAEVAQLVGVSKQRVSELRTRPGFPAPIAELAAGPVWTEGSLRSFLAEWERRPGRPKKEPAKAAS